MWPSTLDGCNSCTVSSAWQGLLKSVKEPSKRTPDCPEQRYCFTGSSWEYKGEMWVVKNKCLQRLNKRVVRRSLDEMNQIFSSLISILRFRTVTQRMQVTYPVSGCPHSSRMISRPSRLRTKVLTAGNPTLTIIKIPWKSLLSANDFRTWSSSKFATLKVWNPKHTWQQACLIHALEIASVDFVFKILGFEKWVSQCFRSILSKCFNWIFLEIAALLLLAMR